LRHARKAGTSDWQRQSPLQAASSDEQLDFAQEAQPERVAPASLMGVAGRVRVARSVPVGQLGEDDAASAAAVVLVPQAGRRRAAIVAGMTVRGRVTLSIRTSSH
jgi:hypothetical protein